MNEADTSVAERPRRRAQGIWLQAEALIGLALVFCPLAIATVHLGSIAVAAALSLSACALAAWAARRSGEPFTLPGPAIAFMGGVAFIAFQLVPLPPALVGLIAPGTREVFDLSLAPLGLYPQWRPLSLDPPATARELAKAITYLALFLAAAQVGRSRRARRRLVSVIGLSAVAVAVIGFGHALLGATVLFGTYKYEVLPPFLTTFGNPNHLAGFLSLGATMLLARVVAERDRKIAALWAFAFVAAGVAVLLTLSRGGIVAFLAGQLMVALAIRLTRRSELNGVPVRPRSLAVPGAVLVVLAVSAYLAWDALALELASTDSIEKVRDSKLGLWPSFVAMLEPHWLVGVGRGAFEAGYPRFQAPGLNATFTHPENLVFQWASELGVPMALVLVVAGARALFVSLRRNAGDVERIACSIGVAGVVLHELVDFGLELGGLAVPTTVAFALSVARLEQVPKVRRRVALACVPFAGVAAAVALIYAGSTLHLDGEQLARKLGGIPADRFAEEAATVAARHPADYLPHLLTAQAYALERPLRADRVALFATRAMQLNPTLAAPHRLAAHALRAIGQHSQARLEYRLAFGLGDPGVLAEVISAYRDPAEMMEAVPATEAALSALADELIRQGRLDEARVVASAALSRHGERLPALQRLARIAAARGESDELLELGLRMSAAAPSQAAGVHLQVQALEMGRESGRAVELLEKAVERFPFDPDLVLSLAAARLGAGDTRGCREALKKLPPGLDVSIRVRGMLLEARAAERDGHSSKALGLMRTATSLRPDDPGVRWQYALQLERVGRVDSAIREAEAAAAQAPQLREEAARLRTRAEEHRRQLEQMRLWKSVEDDGDEP